MIAAIAATVAVGIAGYAGWFDSALRRAPALAGYPDRPSASAGTNWLLIGSDRRDDLTAAQQQRFGTGADAGPGHADTLLLVHLPGLGSGVPTTVVSIPRDSYVTIPGYGQGKVNAAFALGGAPLVARTVELATGMRLDHYAELGFAGLAALVDALGGVRMCLPEPVDDPLADVDLPAGCRRFAGAAALGYLRSRATPRADLDRMAHQRLFLSALLRRTTNPAVWLNPWRWYTVGRTVAGAVVVGRGTHLWDLTRLGWALRGVPTGLTVPLDGFTDTDAGDVAIWDGEAAGQLFTALRRDTAVPVQPLG